MKYRHSIFCLSCLSLFLLAEITCLADGASETAHDSQTTLKVVSYNIRIGVGPGKNWSENPDPRQNLDMISEFILNEEADIVLLQEVDRFRKRTERVDELQYLRKKLGYHHTAFAPAIKDGEAEYGVGIISRYDIKSAHREVLSHIDYTGTHPDLPEWYSEQRVALRTRIETPGGTISVINTHLGITKEQRENQLQDVARLVRNELKNGYPVILGGDFNAEPDASELLPIRDLVNDSYHGFTNEQGLQYDMPIKDRTTYPQDHPNQCIDYLFYSRGGFEVEKTYVPDLQLSDHRPVVAIYKYSE